MYVIVQKRNVHARRQNVNVRWYVRISKRFCVYACLPQIWQSHVIKEDDRIISKQRNILYI